MRDAVRRSYTPHPLSWPRHDIVIEPLDDAGMVDWNHDKLRAALPDFRKLAIEDFLSTYEAGARSSASKRSTVA